jgi:hypothetical protein
MWPEEELEDLLCVTLICYSYSNIESVPVTIAERSKAGTVFVRSDAVIVGSNPT